MKQAMQIYLALLKNRFHIIRTEDVRGGERFHLGVGAVITVYENETVLVQGRFNHRSHAWAMKTLTRILPHHTRWHDT